MVTVLENLNTEITDISERIQASLVRVTNGKRGAGAGTIFQSDGLIVTNAHVVGKGPVKIALPDGQEKDAEILALDRNRDLAMLKIQTQGLSTLPLGDSNSLRAGEWVMAFGHPWGIQGAATAGVIIGLGDQLPERPRFGKDWIAVNLHYRPGHSGGPLVDGSGRLIGINTLMTGPNVGLAIPIHEVVTFLQEVSK
jgi:S1-C subfamily serine protease